MPQESIVVIGAVVAALLVFCALLLAGLRLVRWLRLPQDPPEGPRFEPPPPPLLTTADPAHARDARVVQDAARTRFAKARDAYAAACALHDLGPDEPAARVAEAAADAALEAARMGDAAAVERQAAIAADALAAARRRAAC